MIKYLGSKRRLVPVLGALQAASGATSALDLFTGTTRVAQEWKRRGVHVWAVDLARYAEILGRCYIETDADAIDTVELDDALSHLQHLPGEDGYVTATFSQAARYFQVHNGRRIDAIRSEIDKHFADHRLAPILLTSLLEAADRVDSTTGLQMAYLKQWSPRSHQDLVLRRPVLLAGGGRCLRDDATSAVATLPEVDLAYLDPPYNQHRYFTNYHVWETLVAWDAPRALRGGLQADRRPRRLHQERVQRPAAGARGPGPGHRRRPGPGRRGVDQQRGLGRPWTTWSTWPPVEVGSRSWPSTPSATWGPSSAFTTPKGKRSAGCRTPATSST